MFYGLTTKKYRKHSIEMTMSNNRDVSDNWQWNNLLISQTPLSIMYNH